MLLIIIPAFAAMALYQPSLSHKLNGALPRALECAREALRIWLIALPPGHEDIADAKICVGRLEQAMR
jgi:hypothetical protein